MKKINYELFKPILEEMDLKDVGLFCGAGISYNSGLPLANDLIRKILESFNMNTENINKIINSNLPFEAIIQSLHDEDSINELLEIFKLGTPSTNHYFVAYLLEKKIIRNVITTNFDRLIEQALEELNLIQDVDFFVYSSEDNFNNINWNDNTIKIVKIHGCVSDIRNMEITMERVASMKNYNVKQSVIETFFSDKIHKKVFLMGYSCSDTFDISPQIENNINLKSEVVLLEHIFDKETYNIESIELKENGNPFKEYSGKRVYVNIDELVKQYWVNVFHNEYVFKASTVNWQRNIEIWNSEITTFSRGMKYHLSAKLLYDIGEFNSALVSWNKGLKIAKNEKNMIFYYSQLGNIGMSLNSLSRFDEAKEKLELSIAGCKKLRNEQGVISQLEALGNVYINLNKVDEAIILFKEAIKLSKNNLHSLCSSYGNLASLYIQKRDYRNVIKYVKKGYPLAQRLGKKQNEGSMLTSLGVAHSFKKDYKQAIIYLEKSIEVTKQIGDLNGEAISFLNLANIYLLIGNVEESYKCSSNALRIAQEVGSSHNTIGAYYCIGNSYYAMNQLDLAIKNYEEALRISKAVYGVEHLNTLRIENALSGLVAYFNRD